MEKNEQLVKRLHRDDEEALNWLYDAYHQAVLANIRRLVHSQEESEDILQNVFLALWEGRHRLTVRQSLSGWLFTASYYKSLEYLRSAVRLSLSALSDDQLENVADEADAEDGFEEKMALVSEAMRVLPPRKRMAFQLCRLEGKSYDEAAAQLNISTESVKHYIKSCNALIRKQLSDNNPSMALLALLLYFQL